MLSSGESRIPSIASPRGVSDTITLDDSDGNKSTLQLDISGQASKCKDDDEPQPNGYSCGTPAAAAIGPDGWLWRCENPVKVLTVADTPLQCCAFAKGGGAKLVVGTSAGWLSILNLAGEDMDDSWVRKFAFGLSLSSTYTTLLLFCEFVTSFRGSHRPPSKHRS